MTKRILHVVTNIGHYDDPDESTGIWLSELTHAWHVFDEHGFQQTLVSPAQGMEQRALKFRHDETVKSWRTDPAKMALLENTKGADEIDSSDYDAIYVGPIPQTGAPTPAITEPKFKN